LTTDFHQEVYDLITFPGWPKRKLIQAQERRVRKIFFILHAKITQRNEPGSKFEYFKINQSHNLFFEQDKSLKGFGSTSHKTVCILIVVIFSKEHFFLFFKKEFVTKGGY
jgi:hypothetical protein